MPPAWLISWMASAMPSRWYCPGFASRPLIGRTTPTGMSAGPAAAAAARAGRAGASSPSIRTVAAAATARAGTARLLANLLMLMAWSPRLRIVDRPRKLTPLPAIRLDLPATAAAAAPAAAAAGPAAPGLPGLAALGGLSRLGQGRPVLAQQLEEGRLVEGRAAEAPGALRLGAGLDADHHVVGRLAHRAGDAGAERLDQLLSVASRQALE